MIARVALLCVVELVVVALLALQVFGVTRATAGPAASQHQHELPQAELAVEATRPPPPPADERGDAPAPARTPVMAKWRSDDPVAVLLTGSVRLRDGSPADASLMLSHAKLRKQTSTAAGGSYALVGLQPGDWQVALSGTSVVGTTETITLTDEAVQQRDFIVDAAFPVRVLIVTPDGDDATTALRKTLFSWGDFSVAGQRERFPDGLAPTDYGAVFVGDARWSPEMNPKGGFAGTLHLAALPAHVALLQRHLVLEQQLVPPGQAEVKFVVDVEALRKLAASATLRVLDAESGQPLTQASASLHTSNRMGGGSKPDAQGRITVEGLSPGLLRLEIQAPDHEAVWSIVRVEAGQRCDLGEFRIGAALPLTGKLLDADGKPATANLDWTELKWRAAPTPFSRNRSTRVEADGSFSLWGTGRGPIAVSASTADGRVAVGVFDNPPTEPLVLRLTQAGACMVTRPADPTRAFTVTWYDAGKRPIEAHTLEPRTLKAEVKLPPGDYTFEVHDERQQLLQSGARTFGANACSLEIR